MGKNFHLMFGVYDCDIDKGILWSILEIFELEGNNESTHIGQS